MTREDRKYALNRAIQQSKADGLTFVLISNDNIIITPNKEEAIALVRNNGYRVYAKCEDGYMVL